MYPFTLSGRLILVVGAAGGVGAATARVFGSLGASLRLVDLHAPSDLAAELAERGVSAEAIGCDIADREAAEELLRTCPEIDIMVVTAGICPWDDWIEEGWDDVFRQVIDVNLKAPIDLCRAAFGCMVKKAGPADRRIVLVSSLAGRNGGSIASPHYVAAKGGLNAFVRWLARQGAPHGILVNGVAPASVATPMMNGRAVDLSAIPLGRMATPEEIAGPIAFLCMPASSYMTGTILDVNGGVYAV